VGVGDGERENILLALLILGTSQLHSQ
jgi:hypothetical protein